MGARRKRSWIFPVLIGFALISVVAFLTLGQWLPRLLNTQDMKAFLCTQVREATGLEATVASVEFTPWNWLEVRAKALLLKRPPGGETVAEVPLVRLRLGWREAIKGRLSVYAISLEGMRVSFTGHDPLQGVGGDSLPFLIGFLQLARHIRVSNANLSWGDGRGELRLQKGDIWPSPEEKRVIFQGQGEIWGEEGRWGEFRGRGHATPQGKARVVMECDRVQLAPLTHRLVPSVSSLQVQGEASLVLQIEGAYLDGRVKGSARIQGLRLTWPGVLGLPFEAPQANVALEGDWSGGDWSISQLEIRAGGLGLHGNITRGQDGLRGVMTGSRFEFREIIPYLGVDLIGPHLHGFFREDLRDGVAPKTKFTWWLPLDGKRGEGSLKVLMEMEFEGVSMNFDRELPPLRDLQGTLFWEGDRVWFSGLRGTYKGHRFRSMEAEITEVGRVSALDGRFSLDLTPQELLDLFRRVSTDGGALGAGTEMGGICSLDLKLRKAFLREEPLGYLARVGVREVATRFPGIAETWHFVRGELEASPERLEIVELEGYVANSSWTLKGILQGWSGVEPKVDVNGKGELAGQDLARLVSSVSGDLRVSPDGSARVAFSVKGPLALPELDLAVDLSHVGMAYGSQWEKPSEDRMVVEGRLHRTPRGFWRLIQGSLEAGGGRLKGEGWIAERLTGEASLFFSAAGYPVDELAKVISGLKGKFHGGEVDLEGEMYLGPHAHGMALLRPRDVQVSQEVLGKPLKIRSGELVLASGWGTVEGLEVEALGREYALSGRFHRVGGGFTVQAVVKGEHLDLDPWVFPFSEDPGEKRVPIRTVPGIKRWIEAFPSSQVDFDFREVRFLDFSFEGLRGRLVTREGRLVLEEALGTLEGGDVALEGSLGDDGEFWVSGGVNGAKAGAVLSTLGFQEELIEGPLHLQGALNGQLQGKRAGRHRGIVELETDKGVIRRFPVLANILSLMNLTQIFTGRLPDLSSEGMVFSQIKGSFTLLDGVARTDDFRIYSEAMGLTMVGELDVTRKSCDLKVGVRPFVGFDRLVNQIPVLRHYLAGPEKSVLTTYFLVQGPLADPQVTPIPFRSLGEGIVGIFKRLLENPFRDLGIPYGLEAPPLDEQISQ